jgi:N6-L-threonylcarbamoyladenine synthase
VIEDGRRQLANLIYSQIALHREFGGVVPEVAARAHLEKLPSLVEAALGEAGVEPGRLDRIGVTRGPGLVGCLLIGVGMARGLGAGWGKPVVGVNHLWGHIYAALLSEPSLEPPLLALVVSGAHSDLVWMAGHGEFEVLGRTRDDAAGEAFDKAARMLGLGYPGGPALDRLARTGDPRRQRLPRPSLPGLEYSFSGLKTALLYRLRDLGEQQGGSGGGRAAGGLAQSRGGARRRVGGDVPPLPVTEQTKADLAAAFEVSVVESLLEKLDLALAEHPATEVVVCGGVAANTLLRRRAAEVVSAAGARLTIPPPALCTDNGAMIAAAAHHAPRADLEVDPSLGW